MTEKAVVEQNIGTFIFGVGSGPVRQAAAPIVTDECPGCGEKIGIILASTVFVNKVFLFEAKCKCGQMWSIPMMIEMNVRLLEGVPRDKNGNEIKPGGRCVYLGGDPPHGRGEIRMVHPAHGWAEIKLTAVRGVGQCIGAKFDLIKML